MKEDRWSYRLNMFDGPARCGKLETGKRTVDLPILFDISKEKPSIVFPADEDIKGTLKIIQEPEKDSVIQEMIRTRLRTLGADRMTRTVGSSRIILELAAGEDKGNVDILTDRYVSLISDDPYSMSELLSSIKISDPVHPPLYLPGAADSGNIEALFYLGVEVFDNIRAIDSAMEGIFYTMTGKIRIRNRNEDPLRGLCGCEHCRRREGTDTAEWLIGHNTEILSRRLAIARITLEEGRLREHVMGLASGNPEVLSVIRRIERGEPWNVHNYTHTSRNREKVPVSFRDDLFSPEFTLWRKKMADQYSPLEHKKILLLLPCSARKPYSSSRTHMSINSSLKDVRGWKTVCQRLVLTSPLGIVPMELEEIYPAAHYDIPVTGEWFIEEREFIRDLTENAISKGNYTHIVSYHRDISQFFPGDALQNLGIPFTDIHSEAIQTGTRPEKLLRHRLKELIQERPEMNAGENETMEVLNQIRFSLSIDLPYKKDYHVKNTRTGRDLRFGKLPAFKLGLGGPVPYLKGAEFVWGMEGEGKRVMIGDFTPKGILFNQGIDSVEGDINPGDIVLVGTGEELKAVGRAMVPGEIMRSDLRGSGVKILFHAKN